MTVLGLCQIALVLGVAVLAAIPFGRYVAAVVEGRRTLLSPVLAPVERALYAAAGVDPARSMGWLGYASAIMALSVAHFALLYLVLRCQYYLPLNPQNFSGMSPRLSFNTAISFLTNTNWQAYGGETTLSPFSQMVGLTSHNFLSAAAGIAAAVVVSRAFRARRQDAGPAGPAPTGSAPADLVPAGLGNAWADLCRITLHVLIPVSLVLCAVYVALGMPETLSATADVSTLEGAKQTISMGPVAFQEAIKIFGTNGGGYFNANSAHPFENPGILTDLLENWTLLLIPFAMPVMFGRIAGRPRDGAALLATMALLLAGFAVLLYAAEAAGNPLLHALGVSNAPGDLGGNMEGKEVRFGVALSSVFAASTTATSTGAIIAAHDSLMPLGGAVCLFLIQLGEIIPGGVGSGLYGIVVFAILAVFVAGLMVGRTPEYLGKKINAREVKLAMLAVLILPLSILGGASIALNTASGTGSLANAGPHGLSEMLYAFTSATGNNGSAFAGLSADTPLLDYGLAISMVLGRFAFLIPVLAIAGSLANKQSLPAGQGTFPTDGPLFVGLLAGVILIMGGLQFLPALSLGPLAEHFSMLAGHTF